jgi:tetratricopeptide (TPR) repeat protein
MKKISVIVGAVLFLGTLAGFSRAEIQGAEAALAVFDGAAHPSDVLSPVEQFGRDLDQYRNGRLAMEPAAAADEWLKLLGRYRAFSQADLEKFNQQADVVLSLSTLLKVAPGPKSWPALSQSLAKTAQAPGAGEVDLALAAIFEHAAGRQTEALRDLQAIGKTQGKGDTSAQARRAETVEELREAIEGKDDTGKLPSLENFEKILGMENENYGTVKVPDLVSLAGKDKAEVLLLKALKKSKFKMEFQPGSETEELAATVALRACEDLSEAPWYLVRTRKDQALYQALDKRFPIKKLSQKEQRELSGSGAYFSDRGTLRGERKNAAWCQVMALAAQGEQARALELVGTLDESAESSYGGQFGESLPERALADLDQAGGLAPLVKLLGEYLKGHISSELWSAYLPLSVRVGSISELIAQVRSAASKEKDPATLQRLRAIEIDACFAGDRQEEAEKLALAQLGLSGRSLAAEKKDLLIGWQWPLAMRLALISKITANESLRRKTLAWLDSHVDQIAGMRGTYDSKPMIDLAILNRQLGRLAEAEALLLRYQKDQGQEGRRDGYGEERGDAQILALLSDIYCQAGRPKDVLTLAEKAKGWGSADLFQLPSYGQTTGQDGRVHGRLQPNDLRRLLLIGLVSPERAVAGALISEKRLGEAEAVLKGVLIDSPGTDWAYAMLVDLKGKQLLPWLEQMAAQDRFEERPLIWKAELLFREGDLQGAEAAARAAIKIDPSDGEQGKGDRMRAYAVLAKVYGSNPKAAEMNAVVGAIRAAEDADDLYSAGLLKKAVGSYEGALLGFADAYCVQSRLAVQMTDLGDFEAAEKHYTRAFELMPDSFGAVESHCFGCERVFKGVKAETTAEKVFTRLAKERPAQPQVHYLLGYLRKEQDRWADAVGEFRKAADLDPDYFNAWMQLSEAGEHTGMSRDERARCQFQMMRLRPYRDYYEIKEGQGSKAPEHWALFEAALPRYLARSRSIFPFPASAAKLQESGHRAPRIQGWATLPADPGRALAKNEVTLRLLSLVGQTSSSRGDYYGDMD